MHFGALRPALETAAAACLVVWMAVAGFWRRPAGQLMSWTMFCYATFTIVSLREEPGPDRRGHQHLPGHPPGQLLARPPNSPSILEYLAADYERIDGEGRVLSRHGERHLTVRDGHVVP